MKDAIERNNNEKAQAAARSVRWVSPPVDILESSHEFLVVSDMPGVGSNDVRLQFDRGELVLEAEGSFEEPQASRANRELGAFRYRRSFQLPETIDAEGISAELKNGVLQVHLPKHASVRPRRIDVRAS
jgi:HSP20 family molecular chaperone IbpA